MSAEPSKTSNGVRVALIAEEGAGVQALRRLVRSSCDVIAVITTPARRADSFAGVWSIAEQAKLPTWSADGVRDGRYAARLRELGVELLLNVHSLHVVHADLLAAPRLGAYNLHPGPLPRYAGLNAVSWALYRGERTHGTTWHRMAPTIDSGPIAFQREFPVADDDTALTLYAKCTQAGMELMRDLLAAAETDSIPQRPQDLSQREFFRRGQIPQDGYVDWNRPGEQIVNFVRACDYHPFPSPWGHPQARCGEVEFEIGRARRVAETPAALPGTVIAADETTAVVACHGGCVRIERLTCDGQIVSPTELLCVGQRLADDCGPVMRSPVEAS